MFILLALIALMIERAVGYPDRLYRFIGHPVSWIGSVISILERALNRPAWNDPMRRLGGLATLLIMLAAAMAIAIPLQAMLGAGPWFWVLSLLASSLLAQRSLGSHVKAVADALDSGGLNAGRAAVSRIVGRDPDSLDEAGVARAAIESLAENFSDGVVAPALWIAAAGLPGGLAYKAINTADSMIGHRSPRYLAFGWSSARIDDLVNLPASRLSALLIVVAAAMMPGASATGAWRAAWRDARRHKSPNAGWPEAAMAGALDLALAGPRTYAGVVVNDGFMGNGRRDLGAADIRRALRLYWIADWLLIALMGCLAALLMLLSVW
ncbi:adenosylcobinamide-phosphate synthase CbiB [Mesorhizobium sp. CAU 1741]|uniref:adenosylcobinamide-phosphate synthase CbiB n=1 Tax=Mesorhizobium sp. CAU 1741 TaxID=3140366 RepID=UPI00325ABDB2